MKHSAERSFAMAPIYKHGFSTENKHEILSERDVKLIQQIYGKPKTVDVRAVYNSEKVKVMIRKRFNHSRPDKVKFVFTLKPTFFTKGSETSELTTLGHRGF